MTTLNNKGPVMDPGQCRCCGAMKKCRLLNAEYEWMGEKEIYSEMFVVTFGLLLSNLDCEATERLICATCVSRLRDASAFRRQVLLSEEMLLQARLAPEPEIKEELDVSESKDMVFVPELPNVETGKDDVPDDHSICDQPPSETDLNETPPAEKEPLPNIIKKEKSKKSSKKVKRKKLIKTKIKIQETQESEDVPLIKLSSKPSGEAKVQHNTATIVECSYVCPFDSLFSDYLCAYCRLAFTDPQQLRLHTESHDPAQYKSHLTNKKNVLIDITRIDCRLCSEVIQDLSDLKRHLVDTHSKLIYDTSNEFLKFRLTNNDLRCTECSSTFGFFHALKKHMAEHFGSCICDICGAHYFEERMLILHQKTHKKIEENFPCIECGKHFKSKHSRYLHEARTHKKEPAYQCAKCDEVFFSYSLRYRHMIQVHGDKRTYQCSHCDRSYDSRKSLREHTRRYHLKIFKHQCDLCDKRFYIPSRLKEHLATHTGERNYRCDLCGKTYPRLRGLKVHLQSHNGDKKYRCMLCNASFTQNINLKSHMKRQHQGHDIEVGFGE